MTEQLNTTCFYYHNMEAETIIWVRIRDQEVRTSSVLSKHPKKIRLKEMVKELTMIFSGYKKERHSQSNLSLNIFPC